MKLPLGGSGKWVLGVVGPATFSLATRMHSGVGLVCDLSCVQTLIKFCLLFLFFVYVNFATEFRVKRAGKYASRIKLCREDNSTAKTLN